MSSPTTKLTSPALVTTRRQNSMKDLYNGGSDEKPYRIFSTTPLVNLDPLEGGARTLCF
jgi:hypothetical protein